VLKLGDQAIVSAMFRGAPPRHQFDVEARFREYSEELDLVREGGAWRVDWPRTKRQSRQAILRIGIGPVDYRMDPKAHHLHHKLEVTVSTRVPRDALEAVLREPNAWASLLPSYKSIEPLGSAGPVERARLAFDGSSAPIPVTVKVAGRPVDTQADRTSIEWEAEHGVDAPAYMRGAWLLKPNSDGKTSVGLTLVFNPRHWPDYEKLFSADRLGKSLTRVVESAGRR
jgi:hypothetical protein